MPGQSKYVYAPPPPTGILSIRYVSYFTIRCEPRTSERVLISTFGIIIDDRKREIRCEPRTSVNFSVRVYIRVQ